MGIAGVLPLLAPATRRVNFWTELRDSCVGIDSSVWMHQLALKYCEDVTGDGPRSYDGVARDFVDRGKQLIANGIDPLFVFDGKAVPAKGETAAARRERRAAAALRVGSLPDGPDRLRAQRASISISTAMLAAIIASVRKEGLRYIVAPYEADPQLALLDRQRVVDYVLTVDSDLVVLGVRRCLLKLNWGSGEADLIDQDDLYHPEAPHDDGTLLRAMESASSRLERSGPVTACRNPGKRTCASMI